MLSQIVPCILEHNDFEQVYSDTLWDKVQSGTLIWSVLWDSSKLGGLGDVAICGVDVLNIFWQPGIKDIQDSQNVFFVRAYDKSDLVSRYPQLEGKLKGSVLTLAQYKTDDDQQKGEQALVVVDKQDRPVGALNMHDLLRAGVM